MGSAHCADSGRIDPIVLERVFLADKALSDALSVGLLCPISRSLRRLSLYSFEQMRFTAAKVDSPTSRSRMEPALTEKVELRGLFFLTRGPRACSTGRTLSANGL